ncbi:hypothetical protein, variant [Aphanomyces invadans]|uniref:Uncharacterized protein n=1 Tax=Aphanomyces invadans TaxID=157072 RepID=A0A024UUM9_9STRA|nr:hypothetical protein, variant [Aphanomyces invadans]ETW10226.1 hypothetical protein, variant [Aphanomyces invadans]|eukprot:XP_008861637.1 hypothetical protein, variant [Aphanomyces invadans]
MAQLEVTGVSWRRRAFVAALAACAIAAEVNDTNLTPSLVVSASIPSIAADLEIVDETGGPHSVDRNDEVLTPASSDAALGEFDMPTPPSIDSPSVEQNATASPATIATGGGGALLPPVLVSNNSSTFPSESTPSNAPAMAVDILKTALPPATSPPATSSPTTSEQTTGTPTTAAPTTAAPPITASAPIASSATTSTAPASPTPASSPTTTTTSVPSTTTKQVTTAAPTTVSITTTELKSTTPSPSSAWTVAPNPSAVPVVDHTISPEEPSTKHGKPSAVNESARGSSHHGPATSYTTLALVGFSLLCVFIVLRRRHLRGSTTSGASTGRPSSSGNYAKLSNPHDPVDDDDDLDWQDDPELGSSTGRKRLSPDFNPFSRNQPVPSTPKSVPPLSTTPSSPPPCPPRCMSRLHEPINPFAVNHDVFSVRSRFN